MECSGGNPGAELGGQPQPLPLAQEGKEVRKSGQTSSFMGLPGDLLTYITALAGSEGCSVPLLNSAAKGMFHKVLRTPHLLVASLGEAFGRDEALWMLLAVKDCKHVSPACLVKAVTLLLEAGADVAFAKDGVPPLALPGSYTYAPVMEALLRAGADPCAHNGVALQQAAGAGADAAVRRLLASRAHPRAATAALTAAASGGHVSTVRLLLSSGADLRARNCSPLQQAASNGRLEVVQILLDELQPAQAAAAAAAAAMVVGAEAHHDAAQTAFSIHAARCDALCGAIRGGHDAVARLLAVHCTDPVPPLILAAYFRRYEIVKLLESHPDVREVYAAVLVYRGCTAAIRAACDVCRWAKRVVSRW